MSSLPLQLFNEKNVLGFRDFAHANHVAYQKAATSHYE